MIRGNFDNSLLLTRFILRRERIITAVWILAIAFAVVGLVPGMDVAIDFEGREALKPMLENPALIAMFGKAYSIDHPGFGALYVNLMLLVTAVPVALMSIFFVVRHTRADEEKGRYEVVRSLPTGRLANIHSTMIAAVIVNIILALVIGLGMFAVGDESMSLNGSLLFGASLGAVGIVFAAIAALFSQLSSNSRGAMGYAFTAVAVFYLLRAPGDMNTDMEILALISPLGLVLRTQAYAGDYWWPIFIMLGIACAVSVITYKLNSSRDIDQGLIPAKPGPANGSTLMRSPFGLSFRLLRTSIIVWVIGMFMLGASYASVFEEIDSFIAQNEMYQDLILSPAGIKLPEGLSTEETVDFMKNIVSAAGFTIAELFASMISSMMSMTVMVPVLMFVLKAKAEEKEMRSELLFATPLCKRKYLAGYAIIAFVSAVIIQAMWAIGMYTTGVAVLPDPSELSLEFMVKSSLVYIPAIWVMIGAAILLIGILPKSTGIMWGYFAYTFFFMLFGRIGLFDWAVKLTPFGYVPNLPADEITFLPLAALTLIAAVLTATGFYFYRKRDVIT
ncbi:MAG: ABC transporter permease [Oscillospiraceae bacterium]|nr:ABC transporter permease [Oscillospiraceae bacterium]